MGKVIALKSLKEEMDALADPERAVSLQRFFKAGRGQYGEGDRFLGIQVPVQRRLAYRYLDLSLPDVTRLLASPIHEHRFIGIEILVAQYERAKGERADKLFDFYLKHSGRLNNWDLVDTSAPYIVGEHLLNRPRDILYKLALSKNLWERRIAIVSTLRLVKAKQIDDTFRIAEMLLEDGHDLIHKGVGWALREAGEISRARLLIFPKNEYERIPRTTLRYAIEHFPEIQRKQILAGRCG